MTDIKRDFLYEFNQKVREIYSQSPSIVSVFENITASSGIVIPEECFEKLEAYTFMNLD